MTDDINNYNDYDWGERLPHKIEVEDLTEEEKHLLMESDVFCILPWIHLHAFPDGRAYPCCMSDYHHPVGSMRDNTMEEIWRDKPMQTIRDNMRNDTGCKECTKCYEQEKTGFFSMRNSANKSHGHHVKTIDSDEFKIRYYDVRFSNLCNLSCRTCGDIFSSKWTKEAKELGWVSKEAPTVNYAGRWQTDAWEQLLPHIPYLEEVYFAGGEPLIMEEHYRLLKELLRQGRNDVKLVYNTNFSELTFKQESVLDLWNQFECVSIGASLDDNHERAELMRHGTVWSKVVKNREQMMKVCPTVDFYVSSTLSMMNVYHLPEFHKEWVQLGLIRPMDWNINILQSPMHYRIDCLLPEMKQEVKEIYEQHIDWLEPQDEFIRATNGYKSALKFMFAEDNSHYIPEFLTRSKHMDKFKRQNFFQTFPELHALNEIEETNTWDTPSK